MRCALIGLLLAGCGGLEPWEGPVGHDDWATAPDPGETSGETGWDFGSSTSTQPLESWRVDLRGVQVAPLPQDVFGELRRELVFSILVEDEPQLSVWTAALRAGSDPARQDWCVPAGRPAPGDTEGEGHFALVLGPQDADLGLPWLFDQLTLEGTRDVEAGTVSDLEVAGTVSAEELALAIGWSGQDACGELAAVDLGCSPCAELVGECVKLPLAGATMTRIEDFLLEPLNAGDVAANPECG